MLKKEFCVLSDNELELVAGGDFEVGKFIEDTANAMWQVPTYAVYPTKDALVGQPDEEKEKGFFKNRAYAVKKAMHLEETAKTAETAAGITGVALDGGIVVAGAAALVAAGVGTFFGVKKFRRR